MKYILLALFISAGCLADTKKEVKSADKIEKSALTGKAAEALKAEEDCDDKAKKEVEIIPEEITLGSAGCTLGE